MISNLYHYKVCCAEQQLHVVYNNITESGMLTNPAQSSLVQYSILTSQLGGQHTAPFTIHQHHHYYPTTHFEF